MKKRTQEKLANIVSKNYSEIAEAFNLSRKKHIWPELKTISESVFPGAKVLDAGCGNGRLLEVLQDKDVKYFGFDASSELISLAKKNYPENNFSVMNIKDVGKLSKSYDFIFSIAVISHIPGRKERLKVLKLLSSKLSKEGKLVISIWDIYNQKKFKSIIWRSEIKRRLLFNGLEKGDLIFHWKNDKGEKVSRRYYHAFDDEEIDYLLKYSGLELEKKVKDGKNIWLIFKRKK